MKTADQWVSGFLYLGKLVILKFQPVANVNAEGQKGNGNFGDNAGCVVFDIGVIAADIDNSAEHNYLLVKTAPGKPGAVMLLRISPCTSQPACSDAPNVP